MVEVQLHCPSKEPRPHCPKCGSSRVFKNGFRFLADGSKIQRWVCREQDCEHPFTPDGPGRRPLQRTEGWHLNNETNIAYERQVCAALARGTKNLDAALQKGSAAGNSPKTEPANIKGKLVEYAFYMEKQGYAKETIRCNSGALRVLLARNGDIMNPESVKEVLAIEKRKTESGEKGWGDNRRRNIITAYTLFLKVNGMQWEKPRCNVVRKIPFIPTEQEIDDLVAGCPNTVSTFLQLLKETAMRGGEAKNLKWIDVDIDRRIITLNDPEKGSNPRMWNNVSPKLLNMLNPLPRTNQRVFGDRTMNSLKGTFARSRRRLASKLQNPRLLAVHFHTLRHWRITMEYHRTKDPEHVKAFAGHKKYENTELYIQLDKKLYGEGDDRFTTRVAHNVQEAASFVEVGFEYVTGEYDDGGKLFRKRK